MNKVDQNKNIGERLKEYERILKRNPNNREASASYGLLLLLFGDLKNGFKHTENRECFSEVGGQKWNGEANKTVLILAEGGFGDILQFSRYIPMVKAISKKVILICPKPLISLMRNIDGVDEIFEMTLEMDYYISYEYYVHMLSLPYIFKTTIDTIPSDYQYLYADEEKVKYWAKRIDTKELKVGLVWSGNTLTKYNESRSLKLSQMEPLFDIENVTFFSLQKDDEINQIKDYPKIINFMPEVNDFSDTAAIIENLDLVISVDTSVVHLAASLNKKVWLLSRYDGCWRWLLSRIDSPWYPSLKIYRPLKPGDWDSVIENVSFELNWLANY